MTIGLYIIGWFLIGVLVTMRNPNSAGIAMVAHEQPWAGVALLLIFWIFWPCQSLALSFFLWVGEKIFGCN